MRRFFKSTKFKVFAAIASVLVLGVAFAAFSHSAASPITSAVGVVFSPLQSFSSFLAEKLDGFTGAFVSSSVYAQRVNELELQLADYRSKLAEYEKMKQDIETYENFLGVKQQNPDFEFSKASVTARNSADVFGSFVLNRGEAHGIKVNDPVIYGEYLVGIVKKVNTTTCVVASILDPRVNVGAYEIGTREQSYVTGSAELFKQGECSMPGLSANTSISSGAVVCTSGAGGIFPADLLIGTVSDIRTSETDSSCYAVIKPGADIASLNDVFIITAFAGQGEADDYSLD
ncbi:MAG: rod shape-determining protein MreC [Clostridiales bacterium]|jgi:rod shape-determining protein MreC|nr:rod shape-determining protein MreC [Clostridiales bacterium]